MNIPFVKLCLPPSQPPQHTSPTTFRTYLTQYPATSSKRILHIPSSHTLTATPQGGDCFFHALSWSLPSKPIPYSIRETISNHVRREASFYATALLARGFVDQVTQAREHVHSFCESILIHGPHGHWLGALWGELEILACARAFDITLELFTFDVSKQTVRLYFRVGQGEFVVRLLFTGQAHAGHFDALLPVKSLQWDFWKRFVKRPGKRV